jgi:hypothetical protein
VQPLPPNSQSSEKIRAVIALALTLGLISLVSSRPLVAIVLLLLWTATFFPLSRSELAAFAVAAIFFLIQNYVTLKAGLFEFTSKDVLLMPWYEPLMWGFYFTAVKRFIAGRPDEPVGLSWKAVAGLVVTSLVFSVFSKNPSHLLIATLGSTAILFALFHERRDLAYASCMLVLGFVIELFGVSTGLWRYPTSDFLGIPLWFATMWISAGLLGRRFLLPVGQWLATLNGRNGLARESAPDPSRL